MTAAAVAEHGGIAAVITHPIYRSIEGPAEWQNTIICYDGWTVALSCDDEDRLLALPEELTAPSDRHIVIEERHDGPTV